MPAPNINIMALAGSGTAAVKVVTPDVPAITKSP
jgi:hypothetical protein